MPQPTISVIVPAYNAAHYLEASLPPLIELLRAGELQEVIVVDDCSPDPTNIATATALGADVIRMPANSGPGAARNLAAARAKGDILWFVDADVVVHKDGPAHIRRTFADAGVWAMFGSYDEKPPAKNFASQYKNLVHRYYHQLGREEATTFWSGCGAVRREKFLGARGFNANVFKHPAIEDVELGQRLIEAGGRIRLVHEFACAHLKHWTLAEMVRTDIFRRALPWSRMMLSSGRQTNDLNLAPAEKVRAVIAILWLMSLPALPAVALTREMALPFLIATPAMLYANNRLAAYFARLRGIAFAAGAVLTHQVYYFYSTATFAYCVLEHLAHTLFRPRAAPKLKQG